jgi:hypothetical protein
VAAQVVGGRIMMRGGGNLIGSEEERRGVERKGLEMIFI